MTDIKIIPFHEATTMRRTYCGEFLAGQTLMSIPTINGYMHSLDIETTGTFQRVRVTETNGAPLVDISPRGLSVINGWHGSDENHVPLALDYEGLGALPHMSIAAGYHLSLIDATEAGAVYVNYWPLPDIQDAYGNPQQCAPPHAGTTAFLTEWYPQRDDAGNYLMTRTGNHIDFLALIHDTPAIVCTLARDLIHDTKRLEPQPLLLHESVSPKDWLPTLQATRIAVENAPELRNPRFVIRDVAYV